MLPVGPPPRNSPFEREQLQNTIVFSTRGSRSLPSCLGGGDLDGDLYNVTDHFDLHPKHTRLPASYDPAPRKELNRPSTMEDVADFVVDYINNDIVGIIATNWMIIADQSKKGIFDPDCLLLAQLHSDAVDYPKSGNPVPISKVPKFKFQDRPDWIAPEIVTSPTNTYYKSERALGQLFRDIDLPQIKLSEKRSRNTQNGLSDTMSSRTLLSDAHIPVNVAVYNRVTTFIDIGKIDVEKKKMIHDTFVEFCSRLQSICRNCSLSSSRHSQLSEEEALIGTIVAKCAQPKRRKDLMIKLREQTGVLIEDTRDFIQSPDRYNSSITSLRGRLRTCWYAWDEARMGIHKGVFGAQSFWWISLGAIFDSIKAIESEEE